MRALFTWELDCGRMGNLEALFVAEEDDVKALLGKEVYFGEVLGKHSDVSIEFTEEDLPTVLTTNRAKISSILALLGKEDEPAVSIFGHNPLAYLADME